tara:strand:- start:969 stop:1385 length:417 start_codon:yes stop_codon:yes gene_type:complete
MAALKGDGGKVQFDKDGGTLALITGTKSWSLSIAKDTIETTVQGNASKSFVGGLISGEGTATLIYDNAGNTAYLSFIEDVLTSDDNANAKFELYPDKDAAKKLEFDGIITGGEFGAELGSLQEVNITFITSGNIVSSL